MNKKDDNFSVRCFAVCWFWKWLILRLWMRSFVADRQWQRERKRRKRIVAGISRSGYLRKRGRHRVKGSASTSNTHMAFGYINIRCIIKKNNKNTYHSINYELGFLDNLPRFFFFRVAPNLFTFHSIWIVAAFITDTHFVVSSVHGKILLCSVYDRNCLFCGSIL